MTSRRPVGLGMLSVCLAVVAVALGANGAWAFKGVAFILDGKGIQILGESTQKGTAGLIDILEISSEFIAPATTSSGTSGAGAGKPTTKGLSVSKNPDKATARLAKAFFSGEVLQVVELRFFELDATGASILVFAIRMTNAVITSFQHSGNPNEPGGLSESVTFGFQTILFNDLFNKASAGFDFATGLPF